jgi:hypothetical protein
MGRSREAVLRESASSLILAKAILFAILVVLFGVLIWSPADARAAELISAYPFDEGSGSVAHDFVGENDGEVIRAAGWEFGKFKKALWFDGEEENLVEVPGFESSGLEELTFEAWVKPERRVDGATLVAGFGTDLGGLRIFAAAGEEGLPTVTAGGGEGVVVSGESPLPSDRWSFLAVSCDGEDLRLSVDGSLVAESKVASQPSFEGPLLIGGSGVPGTTSFDGLIDNVRVYDGVVGQLQVDQDADDPVGEPAPSSRAPLAAYSFDEGSGEVAHDLVGNGDASIAGATWAEGEYALGLHFSGGGGDSLTIPEGSATAFSEEFTIETWVRPMFPETTVPAVTVPISNGKIELSIVGQPEVHPGAWAVEAAVRRGGGIEDVIVSELESIPSYQWRHLALVYDGEFLNLYLEGELVDAVPMTGEVKPEGPVSIGYDAETEESFLGSLDEVRIYDSGLSAEEVADDRGHPLENPRLTIFGPISEASPEQLISPDSELSMGVVDVGGQVSTIQFLLDGSVVSRIAAAEALEAGGTEACYEGWCNLFFTTPMLLGDVSSGAHQVGVRVIDTNGASRQRLYPVNFDADPPSVVLSGPLADSNLEELPVASAALEIAAADGSGPTASGVESIKVAVDGEEQAAEYFSPCSEECPANAEFSYIYEEEEWGVGPHEVTVTATDWAGNQTQHSLRINSTPESVEPPCPTNEASVAEGGTPVGSEAAIEAAEESVPGIASAADTDEEVDPEGDFLPKYVPSSEELEGSVSFGADGTLLGGEVAWEAESPGSITLGQAACLVPTQVSADAVEPSLVGAGNAIVFPNSDTETDTLVRPSAIGATVIQSIRGSEAPSHYSWKVGLKAGYQLAELTDGGVAVYQSASEVEPQELPEAPIEASELETLGAADAQIVQGTYEVAAAEQELQKSILAVIPPPTAVLPEEQNERIPLELLSGNEIAVSPPLGAVAVVVQGESALEAPAMCANSFDSDPKQYFEGCAPEPREEEKWTVSSVQWTGAGSIIGSSSVLGPWTSLPGGGRSAVILDAHTFRTNPDGSKFRELIGDRIFQTGEAEESPAGGSLVFRGCDLSPGGKCGIYLADQDGENRELVTALPDQILNWNPTFSADGSRIIYYRNLGGSGEDEGQLWSMKLDGTDKRQVTDVQSFGKCGASECNFGIWNRDDPAVGEVEGNEVIVFAQRGSLYEVDASAEEADLSEMAELAGAGAGAPTFSSDDSQIAYRSTGTEGSAKPGINVMNADGTGKSNVLRATVDRALTIESPSFSPSDEKFAYIQAGDAYTLDPGERPEFLTDGEDTTTFSELVSELEPAAGEQAKSLEAETLAAYESPEGNLRATAEWCADLAFQPIRGIECGHFYDDSKLAITMTKDLFTNYEHSDSTKGNAFQHGYWVALMTADSKRENSKGLPDGFVFAKLHEGPPPYDKNNAMDFINDQVGVDYYRYDGVEPGGRVESQKQMCEGMRIKGKNAIYIGPDPPPYRWAFFHRYFFRRLIYRFQRTSYGRGVPVRYRGLTCKDFSW